MPQIGTPAPSLSVQTDRDQFSLTEQIGKKVVIFFFARADTSSCIREVVQFSTFSNAFAEENTIVIGIFKDTLAKLAKFG